MNRMYPRQPKEPHRLYATGGQVIPELMAEMVTWINAKDELPVPLKAAIAHYQYAIIHPNYDGNGRTARLLTTLILHLGVYGVKGEHRDLLVLV
jgi:Fic family protein